MKKWIAAMLAALVALSFTLTACTNSSLAKTSVNLMFKVYHQGDVQAVEDLISDYTKSLSVTISPQDLLPEEIAKLFSSVLPTDDLKLGVSGRLIAAMIKKTMNEIQWNILSTRTVTDHEIIVRTEVSNLDMKALTGKYALAIGAFTITSLFSGYTENERITKYIDILDQTVSENKNERMKWTVDITVKKINGQWQVVMSEDILNAMTGGMLSMYNNVMYILQNLSEYLPK